MASYLIVGSGTSDSRNAMLKLPRLLPADVQIQDFAIYSKALVSSPIYAHSGRYCVCNHMRATGKSQRI